MKNADFRMTGQTVSIIISGEAGTVNEVGGRHGWISIN